VLLPTGGAVYSDPAGIRLARAGMEIKKKVIMVERSQTAQRGVVERYHNRIMLQIHLISKMGVHRKTLLLQKKTLFHIIPV